MNFFRGIVVSYGPRHYVTRADLRSLGTMDNETWVATSVVDSWAMILNQNERAKGDKPTKFWLGPSHSVIQSCRCNVIFLFTG